MTSDEQYVPNAEEVREEYVYGTQEVDMDGNVIVSFDEACARWDRFLARVRRDAARGAIDGLIADRAHMAALLRAENGGNVEDVLTHYRDTHCHEESP